MHWRELQDLLTAELGPDVAERLSKRLQLAAGGESLAIPEPRLHGPLSDREIREALSAVGGNVRLAAAALGVAPKALYRRLVADHAPRMVPRFGAIVR